MHAKPSRFQYSNVYFREFTNTKFLSSKSGSQCSHYEYDLKMSII